MNWVYDILVENKFDVEKTIKENFKGDNGAFLRALICELAFKSGFCDGAIKLMKEKGK